MNKIRVFLADDNKKLLDRMLEYFADNSKIEIVGVAYDGLETLEKIKSLLPEVLILDYRMPSLDGDVIVERIKSMKLCNPPQIILITAMLHNELTSEIIKNGVKNVLIKPFDFDELEKAILLEKDLL